MGLTDTSRTGDTAGTWPSESLKTHIKHLGGGRVGVEEVEGAAPLASSSLAVPGAKMPQRDRAPSTDSRTTQWFDFYPGPSEGAKSPGRLNQPADPSQLSQLSQTSGPSRSIQSGRPSPQHRPSRNGDLCPAPLRVHSREKQKGVDPPSDALVTRDSKWKALPTLPVQPARNVEPAATRSDGAEETEADRGPQSQRPGISVRTDKTPIVLPVIRYGTPPPTPDSSADGAARMLPTKDSDMAPDTDSDPSTAVRTFPARADSLKSVRHTQQERIWLHVNYRGEAPFLQAWGLDIARPADRLEGLSILRDLMQAEKESEES